MSLFSNTQQVLRHYVSSAVGDLLYGVCGTTGATTQKIYAPFLYQPNDYYNNHYYEVYVYAGTNIGVTKRVTDWVLADLLLTVHSVYAAACDATSYIELHRIFKVDELNKAINMAIEEASANFYVPLTDETVRLTSTTDILGDTVYTYEYTMPTNMAFLQRVITEEALSGVKLTGTVSAAFTKGETVTGGTSGATGEAAYGPAGSTYIRVRKTTGTFVVGETATGTTSSSTCSAITAVADETAGGGRWLEYDEIDRRDWGVLRQYTDTTPKLRLESYVTIDEDLYLRLEGERRHPTLSADTGICYIDPTWIVNKAITCLPQNKIESNSLTETYRRALALSAKPPINAPNPFSRKVMD